MWDYSSAGEHLVDIEGVTSSIHRFIWFEISNLRYKLN
jgi:hypothetical protein